MFVKKHQESGDVVNICASQREGSFVASDRICSGIVHASHRRKWLSTLGSAAHVELCRKGMLTRSRSPDSGRTDEQFLPYRSLGGCAEQLTTPLTARAFRFWHGITCDFEKSTATSILPCVFELQRMSCNTHLSATRRRYRLAIRDDVDLKIATKVVRIVKATDNEIVE